MGRAAHAVTLEQIVSREHPDYNNAAAIMTVGQDGRVYLANKSRGYNGFMLRVAPDGSSRTPTDTGPAGWGNAVGNKDGIVATSHQHFAASLQLHDKNLKQFATVKEFTNNDTVQFDSPARVEVGPSGDFYALGQNDRRVLRISPEGKVLRAYMYPEEYSYDKNKVNNFRVDEAGELLYLGARNGGVAVVGFDGKERNKIAADISGGWDVDDKGVLFAVEARSDTIKKYSAEGAPAGEIKLVGLSDSLAQFPITSLQVHGGEIFIKQSHPVEMFRRYKISGEPIATVQARVERLTTEFPSLVWTAGESTPFSIKFDAGGSATKPKWRVWARPLSLPRYSELTVQNGAVQVPASWAGLYVLKVSPETQNNLTASEYLVREVIEVRAPGSRGTANVLTPGNRAYYGRGEEIPLSISVRANAPDVPGSVVLKLVGNSSAPIAGGNIVLATEKVSLQNGKGELRLPAALTAALRPGEYSVSIEVPGLTSVAQSLVIGPGIPTETPPWRMLYGDYGGYTPTGSTYWDATEKAVEHTARSQRLNLNLYIERLGHSGAGTFGVWNWSNDGNGMGALQSLKARLEKDALGVAPEKAEIENVFRQMMAAYSAQGIRQMAILMYMDAGLPLGTGFDGRKPEEFQQSIRDTTNALLPYPAFRGWSWAANWWVYDGERVYNSPQEKTQYQAALKLARETGEWNPILATIAERRWNWQRDAQELFNKTLREIDPKGKLTTASSGPYRRPEAYPPAVFSNVDEVDLHHQHEQIAPPFWPPHAVDYYKRPGKPAWGHPELFNDNGTGGQILPYLAQMLMRGADGIGQQGPIPNFGSTSADARSASAGTASVHRAIYDVAAHYGGWLSKLQNNDPVAIMVSHRQAAIDDWKGIGGEYFTRGFEAYQSFLYAHRPASFVFSDDLKPQTLDRYKAIVVVGQRVEMEPELKQALAAAKAKGIRVFYDGTCRETLVKEYSPLGVTFDNYTDMHSGQDDSAFWKFRDVALANAVTIGKTFSTVLPPAATTSATEVLLTERTSGKAKVLLATNNTLPAELNPGQLWRTTMAITNRLPLQTTINWNVPGAIYDVMEMKRVSPQDGQLVTDLRSTPLRIFAALPAAIGSVALRGPAAAIGGQSFKWWVQVRDTAGKPLDALLPVRLRLLDSSGAVLQERILNAGAAGAGGSWIVPLGAAGNLALEATELVSGQSSRLAIATRPNAAVALAARAPSEATANQSGAAATQNIVPAAADFGPRLRDIALLGDGRTAVFNAFEWNHNLYALDLENGKTLWRQKAGEYFAFAPMAAGSGVAVQGFEWNSAEGYQLHLLGANGQPERRFALPGIPSRLTHWAFPSVLNNIPAYCAVSPDGAWLAASGNLGLAVYSRDGRVLWQQLAGDSRQAWVIGAGDARTLVAARGAEAVGFDAASGKEVWRSSLGEGGGAQEIVASADGSTFAVRSSLDDGTVFLLRAGKIAARFQTAVERMALSRDGSTLAVTTGNQLKLYSVAGGLQWVFNGGDKLHFPRIAGDGRIVVSDETGVVTILDGEGKTLHSRDAGALATTQWLPGGDLLLGTWMGTAMRLDSKYSPRWKTRLAPQAEDVRGQLLRTDNTPKAKLTGWATSTAQPAPLTPNLLKDIPVIVSAQLGDKSVPLQNDPKLLFDGQATAPEKPWLSWSDIQMIDSGWRGSFSLEIALVRRVTRVTAITFVEDPAHPESWLRDAKLEYWDAAGAKWEFLQYLTSDAPIHTHKLGKPIEAVKFRLTRPGGDGWPSGNLRLAEIVFHGDDLGPAWPPAVRAKQPVAVLFDEDLAELNPAYQNGFNTGYQPTTGADAYSGAAYFIFDPAKNLGGLTQCRPIREVETWLYPIAEQPEPGQYRWLQMAVKRLNPGLNELKLWPGHPDGSPSTVIPLKPVDDWQLVRVDMWALAKKPMNVTQFFIAFNSGAGAVDQIVLGRTEADLDTVKPIGAKSAGSK